MKTLQIIILIFLVSTTCCTTKNTNYEVLIKANLTQILYVGMAQPIEIESLYNLNDLTLICEDPSVEIEKNISGSYMVKPTQIGPITIKVTNESNVVIKTQKFKVKHLPNITPYFCMESRKNKILKSQFDSCNRLYLTSINFDVESTFKIESFQFTSINSNGVKTTILNQSDTISTSIKTNVKKLNSGAILIFDNIKYQRMDSKIDTSSPLILYLK